MRGEQFQGLSEYEFMGIVQRALPALLDAQLIATEAKIGDSRADFLVRQSDGGSVIVEVKGGNLSTRRRLQDAATQLQHFLDAYAESGQQGRPDLALVVASPLSAESVSFLHAHGISHVFDSVAVSHALSADRPSEERVVDAAVDEAPRRTASLLDKLDDIPSGRSEWSNYQTTAQNILEYLLCPPLAKPIRESSNLSRVNRRDAVFPNYAVNGFWAHMRLVYDAHYVVVDAKNYSGSVKKRDVLQLANYLSPHGSGLFGLIVTRRAGDRGAEVTRREQWFMHRKMIIVVNDDDLRQMWALKESGADPTDHIRQKIEDFRLAF